MVRRGRRCTGKRMSAAYVRARAMVTGTPPCIGVSRAPLQRTKNHTLRGLSGIPPRHAGGGSEQGVHPVRQRGGRGRRDDRTRAGPDRRDYANARPVGSSGRAASRSSRRRSSADVAQTVRRPLSTAARKRMGSTGRAASRGVVGMGDMRAAGSAPELRTTIAPRPPLAASLEPFGHSARAKPPAAPRDGTHRQEVSRERRHELGR